MRLSHDELMAPLRFQVDAFLVRDLDSRINSREAAAVAEFIDNSRNKASAALKRNLICYARAAPPWSRIWKTNPTSYSSLQFLHVMRDHPAHGAYIMAGMWGARLDNSEVRRRFLVAFTDMFQVSAFHLHLCCQAHHAVSYVMPVSLRIR